MPAAQRQQIGGQAAGRDDERQDPGDAEDREHLRAADDRHRGDRHDAEHGQRDAQAGHATRSRSGRARGRARR